MLNSSAWLWSFRAINMILDWRSWSSPRPIKSVRKQLMKLSRTNSLYSPVASWGYRASNSSDWCWRKVSWSWVSSSTCLLRYLGPVDMRYSHKPDRDPLHPCQQCFTKETMIRACLQSVQQFDRFSLGEKCLRCLSLVSQVHQVRLVPLCLAYQSRRPSPQLRPSPLAVEPWQPVYEQAEFYHNLRYTR